MNTNDTAPLTAEVVEMVERLRTRAKHLRATWDDGDMEFTAADMLTALAAQLAERDAELARATAERDAFAKVIDEYAPNPALMARIIVRNIERGCDLDTATRRIAALTEALTKIAAETFYGLPTGSAQIAQGVLKRDALTTDKEPTT